jgi:hypothetical protein
MFEVAEGWTGLNRHQIRRGVVANTFFDHSFPADVLAGLSIQYIDQPEHRNEY